MINDMVIASCHKITGSTRSPCPQDSLSRSQSDINARDFIYGGILLIFRRVVWEFGFNGYV